MSGASTSAMPRFKPAELLGALNAVERKNAPEYLWIEGDRSLLRPRPRVSIVGTRKASADGLSRTARLTRDLVANDVVIVSGLARGVDTSAHRSCIDNGGRTIAVLGGPLDSIYPPENAALQRQIASKHLVVSQFAPGTPIRPTQFPRRNRTMALLTDATVIVEAGEGSGTLSQGWEALRLGRALFILKSVAEDPQLKWPAEMLSYGAEVLSDTAQILARLPLGMDESISLAL